MDVCSVVLPPRAPFERTQLEGFVGGRFRATTMLCERRLRNKSRRRKALQPRTTVRHLFAVVGPEREQDAVVLRFPSKSVGVVLQRERHIRL